MRTGALALLLVARAWTPGDRDHGPHEGPIRAILDRIPLVRAQVELP